MFTALLLTAKLVIATKAPYLVESTKTETGIRMVIENPLMRVVKQQILCAGSAQYDESEVVLPPRTRLTVDIETTPPADACFLGPWR